MKLSLRTTEAYPLKALMAETDALAKTPYVCGDVVMIDFEIPAVMLGVSEELYTLMTSGGFVKLEAKRLARWYANTEAYPRYVGLRLIDEDTGEYVPVLLETNTRQLHLSDAVVNHKAKLVKSLGDYTPC